MAHRNETPGTLRRVLRRVLLIALLGLVLVVYYLYRLGCPNWLAEYALSQGSKGNFLVLADTVRLSPFEGVILERVRLFRKGLIGPPAIEAEKAIVDVDVVAAIGRRHAVRKVTLVDGVLRPDQASSRGVGPPAYFGGEIPRAVELREIDVDGVKIDLCRMNLNGNGTKLQFQNVAATVSRDGMVGNAQGEMAFESRSALLSGQLVADCDPSLLIPLMEQRGMQTGVDLAQRFAFSGSPPRSSFRFSRVCRTRGAFHMEGSLWLQDFAYRGVDVLRLDMGLTMDISGTNGKVGVDRMMLVRPEAWQGADWLWNHPRPTSG